MADRHTVLLIKQLISSGYPDKHICLITKAKQPYVNKIRNGRLHVKTNLRENERFNLNEQERVRLNTLNKIISLPELINSTTSEQDLIYIHVLKFFGVAKEEVFNLYFHLSTNKLRRYWIKRDVRILNFDSTLIGVPIRDYLDLVIDYIIEF